MIEVRIIPNSKQSLVIKDREIFRIYVKKPAIDNKANVELIKLLADYFKIKKGNIKIVKGKKSRNKLIEILK